MNASETTQALYDLVGERFPIEVVSVPTGKFVEDENGEIIEQRRAIRVKYETTWKEGGTTPITDDDGKVTGFEEHYEEKELTAEQIEAVEYWIGMNVEVGS